MVCLCLSRSTLGLGSGWATYGPPFPLGPSARREQSWALRLHIPDADSADLNPVMQEALPFIDTAIREGGRVLVHCEQGQLQQPLPQMARQLGYSKLSPAIWS